VRSSRPPSYEFVLLLCDRFNKVQVNKEGSWLAMSSATINLHCPVICEKFCLSSLDSWDFRDLTQQPCERRSAPLVYVPALQEHSPYHSRRSNTSESNTIAHSKARKASSKNLKSCHAAPKFSHASFELGSNLTTRCCTNRASCSLPFATSNSNFTLDIYSHVLPDMQDDATAAMMTILGDEEP
jgi:hypothetical protein